MKNIETLKKEKKITDERIEEIKSYVPALFREADIENCQPIVNQWAFGKKNGKGLYLWGGVGTGKTYCAYALYKIMKANGLRVKIGNSAMILNDIKDDFKYSARDPYYSSKFDEWIEYDGIMIIDDLGVEKPTEWVLETFYNLINTRYEHKLPTIFTTNYSVEEIEKRLGDRLASRLVEMCTIIRLEGNDRRI